MTRAKRKAKEEAKEALTLEERVARIERLLPVIVRTVDTLVTEAKARVKRERIERLMDGEEEAKRARADRFRRLIEGADEASPRSGSRGK